MHILTQKSGVGPEIFHAKQALHQVVTMLLGFGAHFEQGGSTDLMNKPLPILSNILHHYQLNLSLI